MAQFSMKTLMAAFLFLSLALGWWADRTRLRRDVDRLMQQEMVEASALEGLSKLGAVTYQYKGLVAVCFGPMGPPFPAFPDPHRVAVFNASPLTTWPHQSRSAEDCPRIAKALQRLATARPLVYVDLWETPFTERQLDELRLSLPGTRFVHARWTERQPASERRGRD